MCVFSPSGAGFSDASEQLQYTPEAVAGSRLGRAVTAGAISRKARRASLRPGLSLGQKNFKQRLVGHIAPIRRHFKILDHRYRQTQRDGTKRRFEMNEFLGLCRRPIHIMSRIGGRPEIPLLVLTFELRYSFS